MINNLKKNLKLYKSVIQGLQNLSPIDSLKVGAIIVNDEGFIESVGYNYSPFFTENPDSVYKTTLHAETVALLSCKDTQGKVMFISHGCCEKCATEIYMAGIKAVYYFEDYKCSKGVELLDKCGISVKNIK